MPLKSGKSPATFEHNIKAELAAGKPKEQALAIAYAKQRKDESTACDDLRKAISILDKTNK